MKTKELSKREIKKTTPAIIHRKPEDIADTIRKARADEIYSKKDFTEAKLQSDSLVEREIIEPGKVTREVIRTTTVVTKKSSSKRK